MAGTGHAYEIVNIAVLEAFVLDPISSRKAHPAYAYLTSKKMKKFLTSPAYTGELSGDCGDLIEEHAAKDERAVLQAKLEAGKPLRLFSADLVRMSNVDLIHLSDWISFLHENDQVLYGKLNKIPVPQALERSRTWTPVVAGEPDGDTGKTRPALKTDRGRTWFALLDEQALIHEGRTMSHCVGLKVYQDRLILGDSAFYSLRNESNRSLLTAEFGRGSDRNPSLRQVYSYSNQRIPSSLRNDLVDLLNDVGAETSPAAESAGVCRSDNDRWYCFEQVWTPTSWNGFSCFSSDQTMFVMSPRNEAAILCKVVFKSRDWRELPHAEGVATTLDARHYHIEEQRAFAKIKNIINDRSSACFVLLNLDGDVKPDIDTWPLIDVADTKLLSLTGVNKLEKFTSIRLSLPSRNDKARCMMVFSTYDHLRDRPNLKKERWHLADMDIVALDKDVAYPLSEALRIVEVANELRVSDFVSEETEVRQHPTFRERWAPEKDAHGQWFLYNHEVKVIPSVTGVTGNWKVARNMAALDMVDGGYKTKISIYLNTEGKVGTIYSVFPPSSIIIEEVLGYLNQQRLTPSARMVASSFNAYFYRGVWIHSKDLDTLTSKLLKLKGRRKSYRFTFEEAEAIIFHLGDIEADSLSEASRQVVFEALSVWVSGCRKYKDGALIVDRSGMFNSWGQLGLGLIEKNERKPVTYWSQKMELALRLNLQSDDRLKKKMRYIAKEIIRLSFLSIRSEVYTRENRVRAYIENYIDLFDDKTFIRVVKRIDRTVMFPLSTFEMDKATPPPDRVWFDVISPRARSLGVAHFLLSAFDSCLLRLDVNKTADDGLTWDVVDRWVALLEEAARASYAYGASRSYNDCVQLVDLYISRQASDLEARELKSRMDAVRATIKQKVSYFDSELQQCA